MTTSDDLASNAHAWHDLTRPLVSDALSPLLWPPQRCERPSAWATHIPFAHWSILSCKPRIFVELGTHTGASYAAFCQAVAKTESDTRCYAIDTWTGDEQAGFYSDEIYSDLYAFNAKHYAAFSELIRNTFDEALPFFDDGSIDLLHIDGLHTYEAVRHDFDSWRPKLSSRGVVLFHDSNVKRDTFGVWKLFAEEAKKYPSFEFLHGHGLGVLAVGKDAPQAVLDLCALSYLEVNRFRERFAFFGRRCQDVFDAAAAAASDHMRHTSEHAEIASQLGKMKSHLASHSRTTPVSKPPKHLRRGPFFKTGSENKSLLRDYNDISHSLLFDPDWYLSKYKNVSENGEDPIHHFIKYGNDYDLNPGPYFDTKAYLQTRPGVRLSGENALLHYIRTGASLERQAAKDATTDSGYDPHFDRWVRECDSLSPDDKVLIGWHIDRFERHPLVSVLMPVYDTPAPFLRQAIQSVVEQLYPDWELCIADDASPSPHVAEILESFAAADKRIKWMRRDVNGHISAATNSALELATGEFIALMDHDDILPPHALYEVVNEINRHPDADLIYTDEDHIDGHDRRSNPYFKTDYNPDLLLGQNMISHFGVYRRSLIVGLGGMREGFEGSQDYDLALRTVDASSFDRIRHIPAILYHWRQKSDTESFSESQLERCLSSAHRAVLEALQRRGQEGTVEVGPQLGCWQRIRRPAPSPLPLVSVIVTARGKTVRAPRCIESLLKRTDYANVEILIAGRECTRQNTLTRLAELGCGDRVSAKFFADSLSDSAITNAAVRASSGHLVALIDSEVDVINSGWLTEMVSLAALSDVGAVGAKLLNRDGSVQQAGIGLGLNGLAGRLCRSTPRDDMGYFGRAAMTSAVSAVSGACLVVKRSVFDEAGGFDEAHLPSAYNDIDFCLRVREHGHRNVFTPHAELFRFGEGSLGSDLALDNPAAFKTDADYLKHRWRGVIERDPYYNPNLSLVSEYFLPAFPSRRRKPWIA